MASTLVFFNAVATRVKVIPFADAVNAPAASVPVDATNATSSPPAGGVNDPDTNVGPSVVLAVETWAVMAATDGYTPSAARISWFVLTTIWPCAANTSGTTLWNMASPMPVMFTAAPPEVNDTWNVSVAAPTTK